MWRDNTMAERLRAHAEANQPIIHPIIIIPNGESNVSLSPEEEQVLRDENLRKLREHLAQASCHTP